MRWFLLSLVVGVQLSMFYAQIQAMESGPLNSIASMKFSIEERTNTVDVPTGAELDDFQTSPYEIDPAKWGIRNDGKDPINTTKGINEALKWVSDNGMTSVSLPEGTYLIDKNSRINMVGNMLLDLSNDVVFQKETNGKESYQLLYIGPHANNVVIRGGIFIGERETHDYSKKDHDYSAGTHEAGHGITIEGAHSVTIEGVTSTNFTGDGLLVRGFGTFLHSVNENHFVSGTYSDTGKPARAKDKIRTAKPIPLDHSMLNEQKVFELSNPINLPDVFDIYFYNASNSFIKKLSGVSVRDEMTIPDDAASYQLVFGKANAKGARIEAWNRILSSNVVIEDSEFAFNRRQGITVAGAEKIWIRNNELHHMNGTMPQSGIDVEGGFNENGFMNRNIVISDNYFHNNASYDLILYDGENAVVRNNHFASKGKIGLAVSKPFSQALIEGNFFDGSKIIAYRDVEFKNNQMEKSRTWFTGPNLIIDGMEMIDSVLSINSSEAFGVTASNIFIQSKDNTYEAGLALSGKRVKLSEITISGESKLRTVSGRIEPGSIINNLKVVDYNSVFGLSLPPAIYNNCEFAGAEGGITGSVGVSGAGRYVFNDCKFQFSSTAKYGINAHNPKLDLTIKNSNIEMLGNSSAIIIQSASNVVLEGNTITANNLNDNRTDIIRLNEIGKKKEKNDIIKAVIRGNTIETNIAATGISTIHSGIGAPAYKITDNTLVNAILALKENDTQSDNTIKQSP